MDVSDFGRLFEKFPIGDHADLKSWATASPITDGQRRVIVEIYGAPTSWGEDYFQTHKTHGFVGKPLGAPTARTVTDLFEAVRYVPIPTGGLYREQIEVITADRCGGPRFCFVSNSGNRNDVAPFGYVGGVREWSPEWLARGEKVRRQSGGKTYGTYARPKPSVVTWWGERIGDPLDLQWGLNGFETVTREDGRTLVIAKAGNGFCNRWLALLDPGETFVSLMPPEDVALIEREKAAALAAWGEPA